MLKRVILASLVSASAAIGQDAAAQNTSMDAAAWRQDLAFLATELPAKHKNAFHTISKDEWERHVAELDAAISGLESSAIVARLAALVAAVGDAHTSLDTRAHFGEYPLRLRDFPDGIRVTMATTEHADLIGALLVSIDGTPAARARETVGTLATRENAVMHAMQTARFLAVPEALHAFGVAGAADHALFAFEPLAGGPAIERTLTPLARATPASWKIPDALTGEAAPLWVQNQRENYWWKRLDDGTIYVAYNRCAIDTRRPFTDFTKEVLRAIDDPAHTTPRVVIDLRNNGGGDSLVFFPMLESLKNHTQINQRGRLFVLIGARTQSSAMMNALQMRNATAAILAGEPTGGRPNSYGEMRELKLPRSGLTVWYSTKYFRQVPHDDPPSVAPDLLIAPAAAAFFAGRDEVMERVLNWKE